jgi:hypothetical protein
LDYRTAVSFSLRPQLLLQGFLPPFRGGLDEAFGSEGYAEFVGYIGIVGLILAGAGAVAAWRRRRSGDPGVGAALRALALAFLGVFLALGAYIRVLPALAVRAVSTCSPARGWNCSRLAALLAGYGLDS